MRYTASHALCTSPLRELTSETEAGGELRQQIKALESLVAAVVEIDSKRLISAQDPTPEAKLIVQAAKAERERKGFSELPPLPRTS